jgi:ferredoxin/flavodoxin---NADP+ reductase
MNFMVIDLLIIGAGPAGLYAGFLAGLRGMNAVIVDSLPLYGGQLTTFYPEKPVYDIPGFPSILAKDFIENLKQQWQKYEAVIPLHLNEKITNITPNETGYLVQSESGKIWSTKYVLVASGAGTLTPRMLLIEDERLVTHVHYALKDLNKFSQKDVVILGGGDSALDWGITLLPIAKSVTIIHRRTEFRAMNHVIQLFTDMHGDLKGGYALASLALETSRVSLTIENLFNQEKTILTADEVVVCYGFVANNHPEATWGLIRQKEGIIVNTMMETNLANIFAVGNACYYQGKSKNIAAALGEVTTALEAIHHRIFPGKNMPYSSQLKP